MIHINDLSNISAIVHSTGVALGTFDGIHIGHRKILEKLISECEKRNLKSLLYTFSNHPREITDEKIKSSTRIISPDIKAKILEDLGIDYLVMVNFDDNQRNMDATAFIEDILIARLNAKLVVVGYDYRFGKGAKGDVHLLERYADRFDLVVIPKILAGSDTISSSVIRDMILSGNINEANRLLGRPYTLSGIVQPGKKLGRDLGFPTANLIISADMTILKPGVYITETHIDGKAYYGVTNVGINPTISCGNSVEFRSECAARDAYMCLRDSDNLFSVETHIFSFNDDIYDKEIEVEFLDRMRDEIKFDSLEDLKIQIKKDVETAKSILYKRLQLC